MTERRKRVCFDLDGIITMADIPIKWEDNSPSDYQELYAQAEPDKKIISFVNSLDPEKYEILLYTSRDIYFRDVTEKWLERHGVTYEHIVYNKLFFDVLIDDRSVKYLDDLEELLELWEA